MLALRFCSSVDAFREGKQIAIGVSDSKLAYAIKFGFDWHDDRNPAFLHFLVKVVYALHSQIKGEGAAERNVFEGGVLAHDCLMLVEEYLDATATNRGEDERLLVRDMLIHFEAQDIAVKTHAAFYIAYNKIGCEAKEGPHPFLPGAQAEAKHTLQCARFSSIRGPASSSAQVES